MTASTDDRAVRLSQRVMQAQARLEEQAFHLAESVARLQATRQDIAAGRARRAVLHDSAYARLQAQLASLPVIEQAKGIIMAQAGCGPEEAFDLLRKASQRANIPVRDLSRGVVTRVLDGGLGLDLDQPPASRPRSRR